VPARGVPRNGARHSQGSITRSDLRAVSECQERLRSPARAR
jgi:hypothetical protein